VLDLLGSFAVNSKHSEASHSSDFKFHPCETPRLPGYMGGGTFPWLAQKQCARNRVDAGTSEGNGCGPCSAEELRAGFRVTDRPRLCFGSCTHAAAPPALLPGLPKGSCSAEKLAFTSSAKNNVCVCYRCGGWEFEKKDGCFRCRINKGFL